MMLDEYAPVLLLAALALDAAVGDPDWLWRRVPHPVVLFGRLIGWLDRLLNHSETRAAFRRASGVLTVLSVLVISLGAGVFLNGVAREFPSGAAIEVLVVAVLLAQRSLHEHVAAVRDAFAAGGIDAARKAVSTIVGRDPETLDEAGVCRAAIETTAENFSDGIVAPAFWYLVAGLPGIVAYKAINTADSMIGHRNDRYCDFGWAAARLDDVLNIIPARLSGLFVAAAAIVAGGRAGNALAVMWRDARKHKSPNAGWPESAMAAALGLALAGPRTYGGGLVDDLWLNAEGRRDAKPADISWALRVYVAALAVHAAAISVIAIATIAANN